ncbi:hypothetical protein G4B88_022019 [Cannabis sativa]|uniref:Secreted protein n=1 Tax=Cannabis sativa TaxID=3483 RepID=A0A7J6DSD6_CANSA|nr:hypothetical protein G4B88_022019 [Cannabis sativa]
MHDIVSLSRLFFLALLFPISTQSISGDEQLEGLHLFFFADLVDLVLLRRSLLMEIDVQDELSVRSRQGNVEELSRSTMAKRSTQAMAGSSAADSFNTVPLPVVVPQPHQG